MSIEINPGIRSQMLKHAESSFPHECCGFIVGTSDGDACARGRYYSPCDNQHQHNKRRRFLIDPEIYQRVEDEAEELGLMIVSIVHSHPDHSDFPSEFDKQHAWPGLSYIIISVCDGRVHSYNSWRLADDRSVFVLDNIERGD